MHRIASARTLWAIAAAVVAVVAAQLALAQCTGDTLVRRRAISLPGTSGMNSVIIAVLHSGLGGPSTAAMYLGMVGSGGFYRYTFATGVETAVTLEPAATNTKGVVCLDDY